MRDDDLGYEPGSEDYEYDGDRQRQLDDADEAAAHHEQLLNERRDREGDHGNEDQSS